MEAFSNIENKGTGAFGTIGDIKLCAVAIIPPGWMACEGQLLSVSEYPLLFGAIGNVFGGDGVDNFALPNWRVVGSGARKIICVDYHAAPPVLQVSVPAAIHGPAPGYYKAGTVLSFSVQLLEDIAITGGPVSLDVTIGGVAHTLAFVSGSAREWVFADYTVQAGDNGELTAAINLNGATLSSVGVAAALSTALLISATVDTVVPTITFSALKFSADLGSSATDFITSSAAQTITATLSSVISDTEIVFGSLDNGATWSNLNDRLAGTSLLWDNVTLTGSNTLKLKVTDLAGNDGPVTSQAYVLDNVAPVVPTVNTLSTTNTTPTITGTATVGASETLTVAVNNVTYTAGGADLTLSGTAWTLVIPANRALAVGTYSVIATVTDLAGNATSDSTNNELVITA